MTSIRKHSRLLIVGITCVVLGAGASAIATAGAASSGSSKTATGGQSANQLTTPVMPARARRAGGLRRLAGRAVHGSVVLHTKRGFVTVTFDRGTVQSVNGNQLTITEGTRSATCKTVTLSIPTGARVRDNRKLTTLSSVTAGQRVLVVAAPQRTYVIAHTRRTR
jgi:hypothetical protein